MCLKAGRVVSILILVLLFSASTFAGKNVRSHQLPPNKAKVIVTFDGEIQPNIVEKYGQVLKTLKIINGVVAVVDRDDIEVLQDESGIKDVALDVEVSVVPPPRSQPIEYQVQAIETLEANDIIVGWNLQEAGIAVSDTPPPPDPPTEIGAWNTYSVDGSGVVIAIIDTGVNYTLEDLNAPNYLGGYDFYNDDADPLDDNWDPPNKHYGHGTLVSTIALAQGEEKIKGTAPNASYYALKVKGSDGTGDVSYTIQALNWCVNTADPKPDIVNMSLGLYGTGPFWPDIEPIYRAAIDAAYNAGIILVASSGNNAYSYSTFPAAFNNVISVGGHAENQTLYAKSNGGVDVIASGRRVPSMDMTGDATWLYTGTSNAVPHVAGLLALQLQYARENDIDINNGYQWESVKHSAIDLGLDPVYQGKGKARALESIDLIASNWPVDYNFTFSDYAFVDNNYPVYQIGEDVNQSITLTNITDILGNTVETIEDLNVVTTQVYYSDPNDQNLPSNSVEIFPTISLLEPNDANSITLSLLYTIPPETTPGLVKTTLELEFNFVGNSRVIRVSYNNEPDSLWYAAIPADLDLSNTVSLSDFSIFAENWQQTACTEPDWCGRADIDRSGDVDWLDLDIIADNWLAGF